MSRSHSSDAELYPHLAFLVDGSLISSFLPFFQRGVLIRCHVGCSIAEVLRKDLGATAETVNRIQSIILDGKPVDDLEKAFIKDASTLALSAAMPGLVGATLRRGGAYSSFRGTITYHESGEAPMQREGLVRIKLFNLLMAELGPGMLRRGVIVSGPDIIDFATTQPRKFWEGCRRIAIDDVPTDAGKLRDASWLSEKDQVFLVVAGD